MYVPPLELLEAGRHEDAFLETSIELRNGQLRYWLKNDNSNGEKNIWRYQHFGSHAPYLQKRGVLTACLQKVQKIACDKTALFESALHKLREFRQLCYPRHMLKAACKIRNNTGMISNNIFDQCFF